VKRSSGAVVVAVVTLAIIAGGAAYALGSISGAALFMVPVVLGVVLLHRTLRTPGVSGSRCCGFCGFDLRGGGAARGVCPECGGDLTSRDAIRPRRRPGLVWPIAAGVVLILVPIILAGAIAASRSVSGG